MTSRPEAREEGITEEMRNNLEVAVVTMVEKYLTTEAKTRLGFDHSQVSVEDLLKLVNGSYMDKSEERKDELRRVA